MASGYNVDCGELVAVSGELQRANSSGRSELTAEKILKIARIETYHT
jgi:hypothetical protein